MLLLKSRMSASKMLWHWPLENSVWCLIPNICYTNGTLETLYHCVLQSFINSTALRFFSFDFRQNIQEEASQEHHWGRRLNIVWVRQPSELKKHYRKKLQVHVLSKEHWHKKSAWHKIDCGCLSSAFSWNFEEWKTSSKCQPELVGEFISEPDSLLCSVWWLGLNASIW